MTTILEIGPALAASLAILIAVFHLGGWYRDVNTDRKNLKDGQRSSNNSAAALQKNQSSLNNSVAALQKNQSSLNDSVATLQKNQSSLNNSVAALQKNRSSLNNSAATLQKNQSSLNNSVAALQKNQSSLNNSVATLQKNQKRNTKRLKNLSIRVRGLNTRFRSLDTRVRKMDKRLSGFIEFVTKALGQSQSSKTKGLSESGSPMNLTKRGEEMAGKIGAEKIASLYEDAAFERTAGMNAYEVQQDCFAFAENLADDLKKDHPQRYAQLSRAAFESGDNMDMLLRVVVGILLRDRVLKKRDMTQDDVDRRMPK